MAFRRTQAAALGWAALALVVVAVCGWATQSGNAYSIRGKPWPGGTIRFYNSATDQSWAVAQAVRAWNTSGAKVRFVATSKSNAQVVITHFPSSNCAGGERLGEATLGYTRHTTMVYLVRRDDSTLDCNRFVAATTAVHELGHVLGLDHEDRACTAMNSHADLFGPFRCSHPLGFQWRCQLLTQDDINAAVRLYGGTARAPTGSATCPMYAPISPPRTLTAEYRADQVGIALSFPRPSEPQLPAFLAKRTNNPSVARGGFAFLREKDRCPTQAEYSKARRIHWGDNTAVGALTTIYDRAGGAGRYCYAVWAIDRANTPSAHPATVFVTTP